MSENCNGNLELPNAKHFKGGIKNVLKCSYGDCKNDDLERGLWFLLSSPGTYYCNVPEQRSIYSLNLGLNRPLKDHLLPGITTTPQRTALSNTQHILLQP